MSSVTELSEPLSGHITLEALCSALHRAQVWAVTIEFHCRHCPFWSISYDGLNVCSAIPVLKPSQITGNREIQAEPKRPPSSSSPSRSSSPSPSPHRYRWHGAENGLLISGGTEPFALAALSSNYRRHCR